MLRDDGNVESEGVPLPLSEQVVFRVLYDYRFFHTPAALIALVRRGVETARRGRHMLAAGASCR